MSVKYTVDAFAGINAVKVWRPWLRPLVVPFIPELRRMHRYIQEARVLLDPVIRTRKESEKQEGYQKPDDMITWVSDNMTKEQAANPDFHAHEQLMLGLGSIHTTSITTTNAVYDLDAKPEYIQPLREENTQVLTTAISLQKRLWTR